MAGELPACVRCKRVSVLTVCRRCVTPAEAAKLPKPPGAESFIEVNRAQNREFPHKEKPVSSNTIEAIHAWAKTRRDLFDADHFTE